jgi:hypothetical protein
MFCAGDNLSAAITHPANAEIKPAAFRYANMQFKAKQKASTRGDVPPGILQP